MGSDSKKPPRPKHRFIFSSQAKGAEGSPRPHPTNATRDDILSSLTKYARPQDGSEEQVPEMAEASQFSESNPTTSPLKARRRGSARGALVVFLGGFLAVWLYGYVTGAYEIPYLRGVTQSPEIQVGAKLVSSNPVLFGIVSASVLLGALYLRHRTKN